MNDEFGQNVQGANFGSGGRDDLAIGASHESYGATNDAGGVHVLYGGPNGLVIANNLFVNQDSPDVLDSVEANDLFGARLGAADYDGNGRSELTVGIFAEEIDGANRAGAVQVFYGSAGGLDIANDQLWHQNATLNAFDIQGVAEEFDGFGSSVNRP